MPGYDLQGLLDLAGEAQQIMRAAELGDSNDAEIAAGHNCASVLRQFVDYETHRPNVPAPGYTHASVQAAVNNAANMIQEDPRIFAGETSRTIAATSLVDLVVNTALYRLNNPGASLDEAIEASYQIEEQHCGECGAPVFVEDTGVSHHYGNGIERINYSADGNHVAIPEPASAVEMVLGWLEDIH